MKGRILAAILAVLIFSGFTQLPEIKDFRDISQDHRTFTERQAREFGQMDPELQKKADAFHNEMFFSPWHRESSRYTLEEVQWEFDKYGKEPGYGRKGKKNSRNWIKPLLANAQLHSYPQGGFPAITLRNTDLRVLPTTEAHLSDPRNCFLPFDNLQNSSVAAGSPLFVSHASKDKKWVLAETHYAIGWIPAQHTAPVDGDFMKQWETGAYATIIKDKTPIHGARGKLLFKASLGSFFPKSGEDGKTLQILVAVAGKKGQAAIQEVSLTRAAAAAKPLPLTAENMTKLANGLMHEPYGWGGLDERRDCSSTLMDLFSPFGIWLPRNSGHQAKRTGIFIDLAGLSPTEKEKRIVTEGIPYLTLLWLKGHIMLYIGKHNGQALVFHNFWSVKTRDKNGKTGKRIIGRSAITTLYPGQELRQGKGAGDLLPAILGMTLLWPPSTGAANVPPEEDKTAIIN